MAVNKKKTINIASKNTEKQIVETIIEQIEQNNVVADNSTNTNTVDTVDAVSTADVLNTDALCTVDAVDALCTAGVLNTDAVDALNTDAVDAVSTVDALNTDAVDAVSTVDDVSTVDAVDALNTDAVSTVDDLSTVDFVDTYNEALNKLDTIVLDELDTLDTIHADDEILDTDNYIDYDITEDNYCELPALVIDYTKSPTAGIRAIVWAGEVITQYQGVEVFILDNQTYVRPFSSLSNSPFFGVAQHDANIGEDVAITTSGITKIRVSKTINLPYLIRSGNQCAFAKNQKNGVIVTQITSVPINANDILVGYGTTSDTLTGPTSIIYSVNKSNNTVGCFTAYKKILINQSQCKFVIDTMDTNNIQTRKGINTHGRTITVLDPMLESTDLCIVMI